MEGLRAMWTCDVEAQDRERCFGGWRRARGRRSCEQGAATHTEIIRWLGNDDPTTRRMMEDLLAREEEHADDMAKLLTRVGK